MKPNCNTRSTLSDVLKSSKKNLNENKHCLPTFFLNNAKKQTPKQSRLQKLDTLEYVLLLNIWENTLDLQESFTRRTVEP